VHGSKRPFLGTEGCTATARYARLFWVRPSVLIALCHDCSLSGIYRFFGLFGIYFSLQYLSLSDATVITFLAPMFTALGGALFLRERMRIGEIFASGTSGLHVHANDRS
jgi:drug/metabolite transporter (DMT)-like permease